MTMTKEEQWENLLKSIHHAAHILGMTLMEEDLPDYWNWVVARDMHLTLWNRVYVKRKKEGVRV